MRVGFLARARSVWQPNVVSPFGWAAMSCITASDSAAPEMAGRFSLTAFTNAPTSPANPCDASPNLRLGGSEHQLPLLARGEAQRGKTVTAYGGER